ncbi:hypothetical protein PRO82_000853 [Candidatus Protochlamydia amoebophila]|nr:hypothetical protein [Candidatus Protochlamydia amoebophila]
MTKKILAFQPNWTCCYASVVETLSKEIFGKTIWW